MSSSVAVSGQPAADMPVTVICRVVSALKVWLRAVWAVNINAGDHDEMVYGTVALVLSVTVLPMMAGLAEAVSDRFRYIVNAIAPVAASYGVVDYGGCGVDVAIENYTAAPADGIGDCDWYNCLYVDVIGSENTIAAKCGAECIQNCGIAGVCNPIEHYTVACPDLVGTRHWGDGLYEYVGHIVHTIATPYVFEGI